MVDFSSYGAVDQEARSAYSGMSSSYAAARSAADRSGPEFEETGFAINREAYFHQSSGAFESTSSVILRRQDEERF